MERTVRFLLVILVAIFLITVPANAQKNELAVTAGGYFPLTRAIDSSTAFTIGGNYARRVVVCRWFRFM